MDISQTDPEAASTPASVNHDRDVYEDQAATKKTPVQEEVPAGRSQALVAEATFGQRWLSALKHVLPLYIATHVAFALITCLAFLYRLPDFAPQSIPLHQLVESWHHWDTGHYMWIATHGYDVAWRTAYFPLYPMLERLVMFATGDALVAGLLISNAAGLVMLVVLYQLICEDFTDEIASRTMLYLVIFPTAFFFTAGYNEALFLCLVVLSFYALRHGYWWLAAIFGFFAGLTRSAGLLLLLPFCYEYLRWHDFSLRNLRLNSLSGILIVAATGLFSLYCYIHFHDALAFSHAQSHWQHVLRAPWHGIIGSIKAMIISSGFVSFQSLRNMLDLVPDLLVLVTIILGVVGPWRFPASHRVYSIYALVLYLFLQLFPVAGTGLFPLQSVGRYMLEVFPAFIVLAYLGKSRIFHLHYVMLSGTMLFFLLTQFLTGHWVL